MPHPGQSIRGRGTGDNPPNRFESSRLEYDPDDGDLDETPSPRTQLLKDSTRTIIATNDSPDIGFNASINPYRGCEHGCIYCYARPSHEYLGFSAGLDFETKIMVKEKAPELLRQTLSRANWSPQPVALSGVTDAYQPIERHLRLTRRCLEILHDFLNPVVVITKNRLVARDADLLADLAQYQASAVFLSVTTLDASLARILEPRASSPEFRLDAIRRLASAGVPVGVLVAPVIPGLTDHELPSIIASAASAGAQFAGFTPIRLPYGVAPLFEDWLERHLPARKEKVLHRIREIRGGRLNDPEFGSRMRGQGEFADLIAQMFAVACRKAGLLGRRPSLSTSSFRKPGARQLSLFE